MKFKSSLLILLIFLGLMTMANQINHGDSEKSSGIPEFMNGKFEDDYGIQYTINDSLFILEPNIIHIILEWHTDDQYLIAQNDTSNQEYEGLYSRIDWMEFEDMEPFTWGFCISVYNAETAETARNEGEADRDNPRTGCNGFPFSRMKRIDN